MNKFTKKNANGAPRPKYFLFKMFARKFDSRENRWRIVPNYMRIAAVSLATAAVLWVAGATALFAFLRHGRGYHTVGFTDTLFFSPKNIRKKVGEADIASSKKMFEQQRFPEAIRLLSKGVARNPDDSQARRLLAEIHIKILGNRQYAAQLLENALPQAFAERDKAYIATSIAAFMGDEKYARKSVLALKKAVDDKILSSREAVDMLMVFRSSRTARQAARRQSAFILEQFASNAPVRSFCAKMEAIDLLGEGQSKKAVEILESNGIKSGDIYAYVRISDLYARGEEIAAMKNALALLRQRKANSRIYSFLAAAHKDFGNETLQRQTETLASLTSADTGEIPSLVSAARNGNYAQIEQMLGRNPSEASLAVLLKTSMERDDDRLAELCKPHIDALPPRQKDEMLLAYAETLVRAAKTREAEQLLISLKSTNKSGGRESALETLSMLNAENESYFGESAIEKLLQINESERIMPLASILAKRGWTRSAARLLSRAKENGLARPQVDSRLIALYVESGDVCSAAKLAAAEGVRCPIKAMLSPEMNPYSDKFVLLPEAERRIFVQKYEEAKGKFEAYKKLFFLK